MYLVLAKLSFLLQEKLQDLYQLAIDVDSIDKYRSETCSVIGKCVYIVGR